jgi:hypothetical protein
MNANVMARCLLAGIGLLTGKVHAGLRIAIGRANSSASSSGSTLRWQCQRTARPVTGIASPRLRPA